MTTSRLEKNDVSNRHLYSNFASIVARRSKTAIV